jgi:hypothetical protein
VLVQQGDAQRHGHQHGGAGTQVDGGRIGTVAVRAGEPVLGRGDHAVEHGHRRRRALGQRPDQVPLVGADLVTGQPGWGEVAALAVRHDLRVDAQDLGQDVCVDRLAQFLLRAEVMAHQPGGHAGRRGDAPDRGPLVPVLRELGERRLPDAGAGGQVLERRHRAPIRAYRRLFVITVDCTRV